MQCNSMTAVLGPRRTQSSPLENKTHPIDHRPHPEDAAVLLPTTLPPPIESQSDAVWRHGKYVFRANFDSANLECVEQGVAPNEFFLQTRRDAGGTANEKATRTWFYFGLSGASTGELVVLTILNLNKQSRLYSQDYRPVVWCASQPEWQPLKLRVTYRREGDDFQLRFCHRFESDEEALFAFAIPFSYQQTQEMLDHLDTQLPLQQNGVVASAGGGQDWGQEHSATCTDASPLSYMHAPRAISPAAAANTGADRPPPAPRTPTAAAALPASLRCAGDACCSTSTSAGAGGASPDGWRLYYRRQLLTRSLGGRRVEVITITEYSPGPPTGEEPPLPGVFEHDPGPPAALFRDKTVFFVSSRVHPGETPATHIFNGMLAFLLRRSDPRAAALRRRFVFKLVPIVNPDGVAVGNYRTDTLGQNLNRFYTGVPDQKTQPSVYAIKTLLMFYAQQGLLEYYIDLHAHANKKGVFIYGNTLEDCDAHLQSLLYAKLVALNNPSFDFVGCNYTEKNMIRPDKDGASKEGAGRVALYRETGLTHLYTIEANYNSARTLNVVAPASGDHGGRASPPCNKRFPPKFTVGAFHGVGRAILVAALDLEGTNPWSRLPLSEHRSLEGVRSWILTVLRATPETRAAHLPAMSDAVVERLRSMIAAGALRVGPAFTSAGRHRRRPSAALNTDVGGGHSGAGSANAGPSSAVAFGRSVTSGNANAKGRLPPPTPQPSRRVNTNALLPLPMIASHGTLAASATSASGVAPRRSGIQGALIRTSSDGLTRSTSVPTKGAPPLVVSGSPRAAVASAPGTRDSPTDAQPDEGEEAAAAVAPAAADMSATMADGSSESDDGDDHEELTVRTGSPASSSSAAGVSTRFRALDAPSPLRSPQPSFKGAAVYCGRVTEFKFPLTDRIDASGLAGGYMVTEASTPSRASTSILGHVGATGWQRPPSAGSARRPSSAGGAAPASTASFAAASTAVAGLPPSSAIAAASRHIVIPRPSGSGGAVLITQDQIAAANAAKLKPSVVFGRSSSANRRNR